MSNRLSISRQWIVYSDRMSIAACADEGSAVRLITEHSASRNVIRKSTTMDVSENPPA
jgi:hypothetical protein